MQETNGAKRSRYLTQYSKRKMRSERKREEDMDVSGKWKGMLLLREASPQTIDELLNLSQEEDKKDNKSILFARELLRKELISEDLTSWRFLLLHYRKNKRNFPESFFDRLRLEVFYKGIQEARGGDLTLINLYQNIGSNIDGVWFDTSLVKEEGYVAGLVAGLIDEKPAGKKEDEHGFYREDTYGRWREPVASGDSGIIFDSSRQSVSREIIRNFQPQEVR